jgi:hypothetical protein
MTTRRASVRPDASPSSWKKVDIAPLPGRGLEELAHLVNQHEHAAAVSRGCLGLQTADQGPAGTITPGAAGVSTTFSKRPGGG